MDELQVEEDEHTKICTVVMTDDLLKNFPAFIKSCELRNVSGGRGVFKGRVRDWKPLGKDEQQSILKKVKKSMLAEGKTPQKQDFDFCSTKDNVYSYRRGWTDQKKADQFMSEMMTCESFSEQQQNCCLEKLEKEGVDGFLSHFWDKLRDVSTPRLKLQEHPSEEQIELMRKKGEHLKSLYTKRTMALSSAPSGAGEPPSEAHAQRELRSQASSSFCDDIDNPAVPHPWNEVRESIIVLNNRPDTSDSESEDRTGRRKIRGKKKKKKTSYVEPVSKSDIYYAAGVKIPFEDRIYHTDNFTLHKLGSILDIHPDEYEGLSVPFMYVGNKHTSAAWHDEDCALWSMNTVLFGAPKIWVVVAPQYVELLRKVLLETGLDQLSKCCVNVLGHKVAIFDTAFLDKHNIPYTFVVQHRGEFVFLEPNAAHMVINSGWNVAEAVNFATESWIVKGLYATKCGCFGNDNVNLDMAPFIYTFRPDLIGPFLNGQLYSCGPPVEGQVVFPLNHRLKDTTPEPESSHVVVAQDEARLPVVEKQQHELSPAVVGHGQAARRRKQSERLILECLACSQSYKGGRVKLKLLLKHCKRWHSSVPDIERLTIERYPEKLDKLPKKQLCPICGIRLAGTPYCLRRHIERQHKTKEEGSSDMDDL